MIAEQIRLDASAIVELLPLDASDREYALEVLRQQSLRRAREMAKPPPNAGELGSLIFLASNYRHRRLRSPVRLRSREMDVISKNRGFSHG